MKPRITVLTLGVDDLERSLEFYRDGLGLPTQSIVGQEFEHGVVAFFDLQAGLKLAIWPRKDIAWEAKITLAAPSPTEFTIGHNVNSNEKLTRSWNRRDERVQESSSLSEIPSGVATPAIFRIPMGTCGRSRGIRKGRLVSRNVDVVLQALPRPRSLRSRK